MINSVYRYINKEIDENKTLLNIIEPKIIECMDALKNPEDKVLSEESDSVEYDPIYNIFYSTKINPKYHKLPYQFIIEDINPISMSSPTNLDDGEIMKSDSEFPRLLITQSFLQFLETNKQSQSLGILTNFAPQFIYDTGIPIIEFDTFYDSKNHILHFEPKIPYKDKNTKYIGRFILSIREVSNSYPYQVDLTKERLFSTRPGVIDKSVENRNKEENKAANIVKYTLLDPSFTWPRIIKKRMLTKKASDNGIGTHNDAV